MMAFKDGHKQILNQSPALLFSRVWTGGTESSQLLMTPLEFWWPASICSLSLYNNKYWYHLKHPRNLEFGTKNQGQRPSTRSKAGKSKYIFLTISQYHSLRDSCENILLWHLVWCPFRTIDNFLKHWTTQ
jgi:hypothetical protein